MVPPTVIDSSSPAWEAALKYALLQKERVDLLKPDANPEDEFLTRLARDHGYTAVFGHHGIIRFRHFQ